VFASGRPSLRGLAGHREHGDRADRGSLRPRSPPRDALTPFPRRVAAPHHRRSTPTTHVFASLARCAPLLTRPRLRPRGSDTDPCYVVTVRSSFSGCRRLTHRSPCRRAAPGGADEARRERHQV